MWCVGCGVWDMVCVGCGVLCVGCSVWCVGCGVWDMVCGHKKICSKVSLKEENYKKRSRCEMSIPAVVESAF